MFTFESLHGRAVGKTYGTSRTTSLPPTKKSRSPENKSSLPARGGAPGVVSESKHRMTPMSTKLARIRKMQQRSYSSREGTPQATAVTQGKEGKARTITPLEHTTVQMLHLSPKTMHQVHKQPRGREQANQPIQQHSTATSSQNRYQHLHFRQQIVGGRTPSNTENFPPRKGQAPTGSPPPVPNTTNVPLSSTLWKLTNKYRKSPKNDDFLSASTADGTKRAGADGICAPLSGRKGRYAEIMEMKEHELYHIVRELRVFEQEELLEMIENEIQETKL